MPVPKKKPAAKKVVKKPAKEKAPRGFEYKMVLMKKEKKVRLKRDEDEEYLRK